MNLIAYTISLTALTSFIALSAIAHDGARGIVKQRMNQMSKIETNLKKIAGMVRSEESFDRNEITRLARELGEHGGDNMTRLFPESSKPMRSEADPAIWEEWGAFISGAASLSRRAEALVRVTSTGGDREEAMTAIRQLAATCTSCHRKFRRPK